MKGHNRLLIVLATEWSEWECWSWGLLSSWNYPHVVKPGDGCVSVGIPAEQQANIQTRRWLMVWFVLTGDLTLHFSSTRITEKWLRRLCQSVHLYTVILYKHSWLELLGDQELCEIATSVPLETAVTPQNPCKHIWCKERKKRVHSLNFLKKIV